MSMSEGFSSKDGYICIIALIKIHLRAWGKKLAQEGKVTWKGVTLEHCGRGPFYEAGGQIQI